MAYSAVPSVSTGDLWTAANHNTYIRDNFTNHESRIVAAEGSITTLLGNVGIFAKIYRSTAQIIPDSSETQITFDTVSNDTASMWSAGSPKILTIPYNGLYIIGGSVFYDTNSTGVRISRLRTNASDAVADSRIATTSPQTMASIMSLNYLSAGTEIDFTVYQNSGGNLNISANSPIMWVSLLAVI